MWNRKELKSKSKTAFKRNYRAYVIVAFLFAFLAGGYSFSTDMLFGYDSSEDNPAAIESIPESDNFKELTDALDIDTGKVIDNEHLESLSITVVNSLTQTKDYLVKLISAVSNFKDGDAASGLLFLLAAILLLTYKIFFIGPFTVGTNRFFMEARLYHDTKIGRVWYLFKYHTRPALIMFLQSLYISLWSLTIVMGPVKRYSYKMVPFIVAENPSISAKKAFSLSKQMMKGNKWKAFVLDLSFLGWEILQELTIGLVGFFFVNPYHSAVNAELYMALRQNAIDQKFTYFEELNDPYIAYKPQNVEIL